MFTLLWFEYYTICICWPWGDLNIFFGSLEEGIDTIGSLRNTLTIEW